MPDEILVKQKIYILTAVQSVLHNYFVFRSQYACLLQQQSRSCAIPSIFSCPMSPFGLIIIIIIIIIIILLSSSLSLSLSLSFHFHYHYHYQQEKKTNSGYKHFHFILDVSYVAAYIIRSDG